MKHKNQTTEQYQKMVMVPAEDYKELTKMLTEVHEALCDGKMKSPSARNGFVSEKEAKDMTGRKTTWFWERRKSGKLPYKKLGATVYYHVDDLDLLFD